MLKLSQPTKYRRKAIQVLKSLYGINQITANKITGLLGLHPQAINRHLFSPRYRDRLRVILVTLRIDFKLRLIIFSRILLQCFLKTYRGIRHNQGLPCRGQRTHANAKTPARLRLQGKNLPFKFPKFKKKFEPVISKKQKLKNAPQKPKKKPQKKST